MKRALILAVGTALVTLPVAVAAQAQTKAPAAAYKAPRTSFGQPDLMGFWSNSTLTPMARRAQLGDRLVYTDAEVKEMEANAVAEVEEGNKPTDPNAPAEATAAQIPTGPEGPGAYGYFWWVPAAGSYDALGIFGQSIHTVPDERLVVVVNSAWPRATGRDLSRARAAFVEAVRNAAKNP